MMRAGIAADHGGFSLKEQLTELLRGPGYEVVDFGAHHLNPEEDYPDFIISPRQGRCRRKGAPWSSPLRQRRSVHRGEQNSRCACRLIHNVFPAHQGVEDDNMNVFCLGGKVVGSALARELIETFLTAHFSEAPRTDAAWLKFRR